MKNQTLGAIAQVMDNNDAQLKKEAEKFNLFVLINELVFYKHIRERLLKSKELSLVFRRCDKGKLSFFLTLSNSFRIYDSGMMDINVYAPDDEIIKFITKNSLEAGEKRLAYKNLTKEASQFGLFIMTFDVDNYKKIREQLFENKRLASAFLAVHKAKLSLVLSNELLVKDKIIYIDINAPDEEIIKFLLGDQED